MPPRRNMRKPRDSLVLWAGQLNDIPLHCLSHISDWSLQLKQTGISACSPARASHYAPSACIFLPRYGLMIKSTYITTCKPALASRHVACEM